MSAHSPVDPHTHQAPGPHVHHPAWPPADEARRPWTTFGIEARAHNAGADSPPDIGIAPDIHDGRPVVLVPTPQNEPLGLDPLGKASRLLLRLVLAMAAHRNSRPVKVPCPIRGGGWLMRRVRRRRSGDTSSANPAARRSRI